MAEATFTDSTFLVGSEVILAFLATSLEALGAASALLTAVVEDFLATESLPTDCEDVLI